MKSKIVVAVAAVVSFGAGVAAGWWLRKKQEVTFEEVTEEEQQAYAAQFEKKMEEESAGKLEEKDYEQKQDAAEAVPKIEVEHEEGTNVNPAIDTRKMDYANAWKRDEIKQREGYGDPTPGEPEDLSPSESDLDPEFMAAIQEEEEGPRFIPITGKEFYNDDDNEKVTVFWYDRDDIVTRLNDDDAEEEIPDPKEFLGFDIHEAFANADDAEEENAGVGLMLYRKDQHTDTMIQMVRYPMSYGKRSQQEEYGGTDYLEWMHNRH